MFNKTLSGTLLVAGTTIGAGMLGIPLLTAKAGFLPAVGITTIVWLFMLATGYLYLEATLWMHEGANILSMSRRFLGKIGQWFAGGIYLFLYYCLMVAYFAGGTPLFLSLIEGILGFSLQGTVGFFVFGLVFGAIIALGLKVIDRINYALIAGLFLSYVSLIGSGASLLSLKRFAYADLSQVMFAAPVLFSAFGYHNVIPSLVTYLGRDAKQVRRSIFYGTLLAFIVTLAWQGLILGAIPLHVLQKTLSEGQPATAALQYLSGVPWVMQMGKFFAFFALTTSLLGVALSMVDFIGDGLKIKRSGLFRIFLCLVTFGPPFVLASLNPKIFITALGVAGGIGEAFLNGLLPIAIVWMGRYYRTMHVRKQLFGEKYMLTGLFIFGLSVVILEIFILT